jgi:hypothetical protein
LAVVCIAPAGFDHNDVFPKDDPIILDDAAYLLNGSRLVADTEGKAMHDDGFVVVDTPVNAALPKQPAEPTPPPLSAKEVNPDKDAPLLLLLEACAALLFLIAFVETLF